MSYQTSSPAHWYEHPTIAISLGVILVAALVLLIEAVFVMSTGWAFVESILGGRITWRAILLLLFMPLTTASLLNHYRARPKSQRVAFTLCVVGFAIIACWISVEFTW
jgi:hypothetical protein